MDMEDETLQMHLLHRSHSNPVKSHVIHKVLLDLLRSKNIKQFRNVLEQSLRRYSKIIDVNYAYPNLCGETCLDIACINGLPEFAKCLIENGANVNRINETHSRGPIHFATDNGYLDVLEILLDAPNVNPNLEAEQQTALHLAVKKKDMNCAALLLKKGCSPNIPNNKGLTALHMAAMRGQKAMVNLLMEMSRHALDLDSYKDYNGFTTREILTKKFPEISLPSVKKRETNFYDLKYFLIANDEKNFLRCFHSIHHDEINKNVAEDLIKMAVQRNLKNAVLALLGKCKGVGWNLEKAVHLAIEQGSPTLLQEILMEDVETNGDMLLDASMELGMPGKEGSEDLKNRLECLKLILNRGDVDVRCTDSKGNTPLHYAARADCREAITLLLEKGSYIGQMNNFGVPPIADISVSTLSRYFDDCVQARKERMNEYTIEFDYRCLMPQLRENYLNQELREMDVFQYIATSSGLKHLLKHPLLSSFVYLKWRRIRHFLYLNFAIYLLFYLALNSYILLAVCAADSKDPGVKRNSSKMYENTTDHSSSVSILQILTGIMLTIMTLREALQFISSPCHYLSSFENWIEATLIILGYTVLNHVGTRLTAIVILLSAWELVILVGKHPRMSTGIEMFKTVSFNFIRFLFLYAFLILAFALAFFTLFKDDDEDNFPDPGHSLFKTVIMLTGEFDASDIPFVSHPIVSRLVFILFVFLIAIVLFNLLNGLAVSDTADILGKAELVGLISRIQVLTYVENIAIRTPFTCTLRGSICCGRFCNCGWKPPSFVVRKMLLFPNYLKGGILCVKPYDNFEIYANEVYNEGRSSRNYDEKVFPTSKMDPHIIARAKEVLLRRGRESEMERIISEISDLREIVNSIDVTLNAVKQKFENNNVNIVEKRELT